MIGPVREVNVSLRIRRQAQRPVQSRAFRRAVVAIETALLIPYPGEGGNPAVREIDPANHIVMPIGNKDVAIRINRNIERNVHSRLGRRPTITGVVVPPHAGNGRDNPRLHVDAPDSPAEVIRYKQVPRGISLQRIRTVHVRLPRRATVAIHPKQSLARNRADKPRRFVDSSDAMRLHQSTKMMPPLSSSTMPKGPFI